MQEEPPQNTNKKRRWHLVISLYSTSIPAFFLILFCLFHHLSSRLLGLATEDLSTIDEATLSVDARVDKVGVVEGELDSAVNDVVHGLNSEHE